MIQVVAAIIFNHNEVLIAKRNKEKYLGGFWEFPGGKIEKGETPEESLIREIKEELDIEIKIIDKFGETVYDYQAFKINLMAYKAEIDGGCIVAREHEAWRWVKIEALGAYEFAPADVVFVQKLMRGKQDNF